MSGADEVDPGGPAWGKRGVYVRLSKRRKARLWAIARELGETDSPHKALSEFIERGEVADADELGLEAPRSPGACGQDERLARIEAALEELRDRVCGAVEALAASLAALSTQAPARAERELGQWISDVAAERGQTIRRAAIVRVRALALRADADGALVATLAAELVAIDGQPLSSPVPTTEATMRGLAATSALARPSGQPLATVWAPTGRGRWRVSAHAIGADGSGGRELETLEI